MAIGVALGVVIHVSVPPPVAGPDDVQVAGVALERSDGVAAEQTDAVVRGVVMVEAAGCGEVRQGSATAVRSGSTDLLLTNAHVVRGSGTVSVWAEGAVRVAQVLGTVPGRDAAVLAVDVPRTGPEPIEHLDLGVTPEPGDAVVVGGFPAGEVTVEPARVVGIERRAAFGGSSDVLLVDAPVRGGSSGGVVLDVDGRAVGLVAAKDPATGGAVAYPMSELLVGAADSLGPVPSC